MQSIDIIVDYRDLDYATKATVKIKQISILFIFGNVLTRQVSLKMSTNVNMINHYDPKPQ